jgi:DNA-binding MarR family transcriptional regulator
MSREIELMTEIRDLLLLLAEPALAQRDQKFRDALRKIVGKGQKNVAAVFLMNGSLSQSAIAKQAQIDQGQLSRLIKSLAKESLIAADEKHPKLVVAIPVNFFENAVKQDE